MGKGIDTLYPNASIFGIFRNFDLYGQPISMNFENKQTHQTIFGGIISLLFIGGFGIYFLQSMLHTSIYYRKDQVSTFSKMHGYETPQPAITLGNGTFNEFDFIVYINTPGFNNYDNQYGQFVLHMYTNMDDQNDTEVGGEKPDGFTFYDIEVPLVECTGVGEEVDWREQGDEDRILFYCPKFDTDHFLYGGFWGK